MAIDHHKNTNFNFRFSVVTPSFNRAHLLKVAFASLCVQTFRNFEWIIVDDGSSDGTQELVQSWKPDFPIRYRWKANGGTHTALNVATQMAQGEFITQLDSDDYLLPNALERFDHHWRQIPDSHKFACAVALCCYKDGKLLGSPLPSDCVDTFSVREALALSDADRSSIMRTEVCREFLFPEFPGEKFIPPAVVYNRMLNKYGARFFNEVLKVAGYAPGHQSGGLDMRWSCPRGAFFYYRELASFAVPLRVRIKSVINAARFARVAFLKKIQTRSH